MSKFNCQMILLHFVADQPGFQGRGVAGVVKSMGFHFADPFGVDVVGVTHRDLAGVGWCRYDLLPGGDGR